MSSSAGATGELQERVRATVDAWNAHDGAAVAERMTEDAVYVNLGLGERLEGRAAVREYVDRLATTFSSDYRLEVGTVVGDDETVAVEWTMTGTNDGADPQTGLPATGQRFRIAGVTVSRMRDDQAAESRVYWNLADYLQQVGLMPAPATSSSA
jgi:steroid delta-isomerase-like uncharacterized protein